MNSDLILSLIMIISCVTFVVSIVGAWHIKAVKPRSIQAIPEEMQLAMEDILNGISPDQKELLAKHVHSFLNEETCEQPQKMLIEQIISNIMNRFAEREAYRCFSLIRQGEIGTLEDSTNELREMLKGKRLMLEVKN